MATFEEIRQAMINAEDDGSVINGAFGPHREPCIYWVDSDFIIVYITDDETFNAEMLTEDMIDDLIIEER